MATPLISDEEITSAFSGANFGHTRYRELLQSGVMKSAMGYSCGHTITVIMRKMKLIGKNNEVLERGRLLLREAYHDLVVNDGLNRKDPGLQYARGRLDGIEQAANEIKQLCRDFSDRQNRPYMGDVHGAIDGLTQQMIDDAIGVSAPVDLPADAHLATPLNLPRPSVHAGAHYSQFLMNQSRQLGQTTALGQALEKAAQLITLQTMHIQSLHQDLVNQSQEIDAQQEANEENSSCAQKPK